MVNSVAVSQLVNASGGAVRNGAAEKTKRRHDIHLHSQVIERVESLPRVNGVDRHLCAVCEESLDVGVAAARN